jgi:predicted TIM-barrel fold metal-dependent hydrolase
MARALNEYMVELCSQEPRIIGLATVLPGELEATSILKDAFDQGLQGVKLHCHVQCFSPDADSLWPIYRLCADHQRPLVIHAGREPISTEYACDPHQLCSAERIERVLKAFPSLKLCVPHLGADEFEGYERLLGRYDNLWLDTTMAIADYLPMTWTWGRLLRNRPDRILYGTDFPNIPYAWDRELRKLLEFGLSSAAQSQILGGTALKLFS